MLARVAATPGSEAERGSITVLSAAVMAALVVLAMGASDVARVLHAASRAQTAADAAALAAAQALAIDEPGPEPAELAGRVRRPERRRARDLRVRPRNVRGDRDRSATGGRPVPRRGDRTVRAEARAQVDLPVP